MNVPAPNKRVSNLKQIYSRADNLLSHAIRHCVPSPLYNMYTFRIVQSYYSNFYVTYDCVVITFSIYWCFSIIPHYYLWYSHGYCHRLPHLHWCVQLWQVWEWWQWWWGAVMWRGWCEKNWRQNTPWDDEIKRHYEAPDQQVLVPAIGPNLLQDLMGRDVKIA